MPIVSVVLPVFNGEKTIRATIDSVLAQTFSDFELIIINDGSTDSTLEIVSQYQDSRLKVFSYSNAGLSATRNRGISLASGEYIACIDADDLWLVSKLEVQLNALKNNPEAVLAYSWTDFIGESGQVTHSGSHAKWSGYVYEQLLIQHFLESGSNALIRKSILEKVGLFDESLKAAEDWDLHLRIAAHYPFAVTPSVQVLYRQPAQSMSSNVLRQEQESLKVLKRAFEQSQNSWVKRQSLANLYLYLTFKAVDNPLFSFMTTATLQYYLKSIYYDPSFLSRRTKLMLILLIKIVTRLILPAQVIEKLGFRSKAGSQ